MERTYFIDRAELFGVGFSAKATRQFEDFQRQQASTEETVQSNVAGTQALRDASFVTLSPNAELPNERVLQLGTGLAFDISDTHVTLDTTGLVRASGGHEISLVAAGTTEIILPLTGFLVTRDAEEVLRNKTLPAPVLTDLENAADDAAAAAAGVPVGGVYRNGSNLQVRVA
ncbi:hypothetical protein [Aurantiacibacter spongiae]|uniref:Uncharacterized protein n=1 Tax=Aurantiacibacter spongiae TaxID=2488860 RepID=A0A3N5DII5_9SPHN|nr:hypothetical protein [Aurantiacibacter spongiae]RPF70445.1 hypothetical protein EG799_01480 [Aurantiacibacter spongiae]